MERYKQYMPTSACEVKVSQDDKLGELAEKLYEYMEEDGLIVAHNSHIDSNNEPYFYRSKEFNREQITENFSERTFKFLYEEFYKYLEVDFSDFVKADKIKPSLKSDQRYLINTASRVPGILPTYKILEKGLDFWQSGIFHMDYGFGLNQYKFIIYLDDVEEDEGGVTFTKPLITPYLEDGTPRWNGTEDTLKLNVEPINTEDLVLDQKIGKKGSVVCFNSHIAHSARFPTNNIRRAIHLVFRGIRAKEYDRVPQPINFKINQEYTFK